jgi:hypothetical protein
MNMPRALPIGITAWLALSVGAAAQPAIDGYADYEAYRRQVAELDDVENVAVRSLARTQGGREVFLVVLGRGEPDRKPALLIVGNVHAPHLVGAELALRVARSLALKARSDEPTRKLLDRFTLYVIPRPNPDGSEAFVLRPYRERDGNARPTDDDRDGAVGEDPPDDLNGDGQITAIRVLDGTGPFFPRPDEPRVMIRADRAKNERGGWSLYVEGRDADQDDEQSEDAADGASFNRNFTFRYPYFQRGSGPHQVSEPETRAVADFCFSRPNIALVLAFTPEDNLLGPWKPSPASDAARIKTAVHSADAPFLDYMAEKYRAILGAKDPPPSPAGAGSFSEWAYFHYGRWSLAARGWWIPKVVPPAPTPAEPKLSNEKRGADEVNALRWFAQENVDGFVPWTAIDHPDFPGKKVEVGGFKPFVRLNPPAKELEPLAQRHASFVEALLGWMPTASIDHVRVESLGGGVHRVTANVVNSGYLPTISEMGRITREAYPLQLRIGLPPTATLVQGSARTSLPRLLGNGGSQSHTWLVRQKAPATVQCTVSSPTTGEHSAAVELK